LKVQPGIVDMEIGVAGPYPDGSPEAIEVRAFSPQLGAPGEDPVTGSLNASLAQWLLATGRVTAPYVASQGTALGRRGRVRISRDDDGQVWVGGGTVTCVSGTVEARVRFGAWRRQALRLRLSWPDGEMAGQEFLGAPPGAGRGLGIMEHGRLPVVKGVPGVFLDVDFRVLGVSYGFFHPRHLITRDVRVVPAEVELDRER
jgi:hypothetical protein